MAFVRGRLLVDVELSMPVDSIGDDSAVFA